jgi:NAD-dependent deacetylase
VPDAATRELPHLLRSALARPGLCVILTGAGISAESGVPTFRGKDGYWVIGSRNYHAQELATRAAFSRMPESVWGWYLHRLRVCRAARPNPAHEAVAALERALGERFRLITQNVDGLHARAGNDPARTYEIHGNISQMRCSGDCAELVPVPEAALAEAGAGLERWLTCADCGAWMRPHVLWFDEFYDEPLFRFESSLQAADHAALLVVVGTTGSTNLPLAIGERAARRRVPMVVVNSEPNSFATLVAGRADSIYLEGRAGDWMPRIERHVREAS